MAPVHPKAIKAAAKRTTRELHKRIRFANEAFESFTHPNGREPTLEERLSHIHFRIGERFGISTPSVINQYIYAAHGQGGYKNHHGKVKKFGGGKGRELTEARFGHQVVHEFVEGLFESNMESPHLIPHPREIIAEHGFERERVYTALRKMALKHPEAYAQYREKVYRDQISYPIDGRTIKTFATLSEVKILHDLIKEEHPDTPIELIIDAVAFAKERDPGTVSRQMKGVLGLPVARYEKYSRFFANQTHSALDTKARALKEIGFEAYNLMGLAKSRAMEILKSKLKELPYVGPKELEEVANHVYEEERKRWGEKNGR